MKEYMGFIFNKKYYMLEIMLVYGCKVFENGMFNNLTIKFISILVGN